MVLQACANFVNGIVTFLAEVQLQSSEPDQNGSHLSTVDRDDMSMPRVPRVQKVASCGTF